MDRTKEQIKFNTEIIKLIVLLMVATGGDALSLIIHGLSHGARDVILAAAGMIIAMTCFNQQVMNYEVISYVLIGSLFTAIMVPLIALLRKSVQEERRLKEGEPPKEPNTPLEQPEELIAG